MESHSFGLNVKQGVLSANPGRGEKLILRPNEKLCFKKSHEQQQKKNLVFSGRFLKGVFCLLGL